MAKMGRPTKDDPISHVVSVKFNEKDYSIMVEYAKRHDMTVSQVLFGMGLKCNLRKIKQDLKCRLFSPIV